jgi:hypothetical protein
MMFMNINVGKDAKTVNVHLKLSLRAGVKNKSLKQSKGTDASGSFKIGEVVKPKKKPAANSPFKGYPNSSKRIRKESSCTIDCSFTFVFVKVWYSSACIFFTYLIFFYFQFWRRERKYGIGTCKI